MNSELWSTVEQYLENLKAEYEIGNLKQFNLQQEICFTCKCIYGDCEEDCRKCKIK